MEVIFLFIDEKGPDTTAPRKERVVSLTGVLVPVNRHKEFRSRYYSLLREAMAEPEHVMGRPERVHAADLLPDCTDDEVRFMFLEGLVDLVNDLNFRIIRAGYLATRKLLTSFGGEKGVVDLCFGNILYMLRNAIADVQVWPVIETDRSHRQDMNTAGMMQRADYWASDPSITRDGMWLKDSNFGEVFYMTKSSGYGSMVDCVGYLLHAKWRQSKGYELTPYKKRLAEIASKLSTIDFDEISTMTFRSPKGA